MTSQWDLVEIRFSNENGSYNIIYISYIIICNRMSCRRLSCFTDNVGCGSAIQMHEWALVFWTFTIGIWSIELNSIWGVRDLSAKHAAPHPSTSSAAGRSHWIRGNGRPRCDLRLYFRISYPEWCTRRRVCWWHQVVRVQTVRCACHRPFTQTLMEVWSFRWFFHRLQTKFRNSLKKMENMPL